MVEAKHPVLPKIQQAIGHLEAAATWFEPGQNPDHPDSRQHWRTWLKRARQSIDEALQGGEEER